MGLFSWLTGGGETAGKVIDTVSNGLDMAFYTDEEKSQHNLKVLDFKIKWMKATSGQDLARRLIAVGVVGLFIVAVAMIIISWPFMPEYSKFIFEVMKDLVLVPFSAIIIFYFGGHAVGKLKG